MKLKSKIIELLPCVSHKQKMFFNMLIAQMANTLVYESQNKKF